MNSRLWASLVSFVVSQRHLYRKHISLSTAGGPHHHQADVLIAECIKVSNFVFSPTSEIAAFKSIIVVATGVLVMPGTKVVIAVASAKVAIVKITVI
jgi:hypothetical protein